MARKFSCLEIRFCVEFQHPLEGKSFVESYQTEREAEDTASDGYTLRRFFGLYARERVEAGPGAPLGILAHIRDWDHEADAVAMLDLLSGTTAQDRATAGDAWCYIPPEETAAYSEAVALAALCTWEAMLEMRRTCPSLEKQFEDERTCEMRSIALALAPLVEASYLTLSDEDRDSTVYDWEFVPAFVALEWGSEGSGWRAGLTMAESRAKAGDDDDADYYLDAYGEDWHEVDCFDVDQFVASETRQPIAVTPATPENGVMGILAEIDAECSAAIAGEPVPEAYRDTPDKCPAGLRTLSHIKFSMIRQAVRAAMAELSPTPDPGKPEPVISRD